MATSVIKLEPIRMGSLISTSQTAALAPGQKYMPPNMRAEPQQVKVDLSVNNFPCLGTTPKVKTAWGKHTIQLTQSIEPPIPVTVDPVSNALTRQNMKEKLKEQLRQAELDDEESQKPREEDPLKMTRAELLSDGWAILSLKSVKEVIERLNTPITSQPFED
uniref:Uncharacterized protein n=1 Tax=viral metagenome TaxID=1070528 RepID=A0A6C0AMD9_9ZZZZ